LSLCFEPSSTLNKFINPRRYGQRGDRLSDGHFKASMVMAAALVLIAVGPSVSAAGFYGSIAWPSMSASTTDGVVQLSSTYGGYNSIASSTVPGVSVMRLGSYSPGNASAALPSGALQLSGFYGNMGSYTNMYFTPILGGVFGSGGGCASCG